MGLYNDIILFEPLPPGAQVWPKLMKAATPSRIVNLSIVANPFIIKGPGEMSFSLQLYNAEGKTINAFPQAGVIRMEQR